MSSRFFHIVLLGVILCLTVVVQFSFRNRYAEERRSIATAALKQRVATIAKFWNAVHCTRATPEQISQQVLHHVSARQLALSQVQREKLSSRVAETLHYLYQPQFEAYLLLKTRDLHWRFDLTQRARRLVNTNALAHFDAPETTARNAAQQLWQDLRRKDQDWAENCLAAVCLTNIAVAINQTNCYLLYLSTLANPPRCGCLGLTGLFESSKHDALFGVFRNVVILWVLKLTYDGYFKPTKEPDAALPTVTETTHSSSLP